MTERFEHYALRLAERDNVAVARRPVPAGISLNGSISLVAAREIPAGHKIAASSLSYDPMKGSGDSRLGQEDEGRKMGARRMAPSPSPFIAQRRALAPN